MNFLEKIKFIIGVADGLTGGLISTYLYTIIGVLLFFSLLTSIGLFLINKKKGNKLASILSWFPILKTYSYLKISGLSIFRYVINPIILLIIIILIGKYLSSYEDLKKFSEGYRQILYLIGFLNLIIVWFIVLLNISKKTGNGILVAIGMFLFPFIIIPIVGILNYKNKKVSNKFIVPFLIITIILSIFYILYNSYIKSKEINELTKDNKVIKTNIKKGTEENTKNNSSKIKCISNKLADYNKTYSNFGSFLGGKESKNYAFKVGGKKEYVILNGENILEKYGYEDIRDFSFSNDFNHYVFIAEKNGKETLIKDGKEIKNENIDYINPGYGKYYKKFGFKFSKNNEKVLYTVQKGDKIFFAVNGKIVSRGYDIKKVPELIYSDNFETIVFKENKKEENLEDLYSSIYYDYYLNGEKVSKNYKKIKNFVISNDGKSYMYVTDLGKIDFLIKDGKRIQIAKYIGDLKYSNDGKKYLYFAKKGNYDLVFVNGKEKEKYENIDEYYFYDDGKYALIIKTKNNKEFININGKESKKYDKIFSILDYKNIYSSKIIFSKNGKNYAYVADLNDKKIIIYNGKESKKYDRLINYAGGKRILFNENDLIYLGNRDDSWFLVINNQEIRQINLNGKGDIIYKDKFLKWSSYENKQTEIDEKGNFGKTFKIIDGYSNIGKTKELYNLAKKYDNYGYGYLSKDKKHSVLLGKKGNTFYIVKDGEEIIKTKNFISGIYPINGAKSFLYDVENGEFTSRILVKCE